MLFIDFVDIIFLAVGIAVGVIITTVADYMTCVDCMVSMLEEFEEVEITNE